MLLETVNSFDLMLSPLLSTFNSAFLSKSLWKMHPGQSYSNPLLLVFQNANSTQGILIQSFHLQGNFFE